MNRTLPFMLLFPIAALCSIDQSQQTTSDEIISSIMHLMHAKINSLEASDALYACAKNNATTEHIDAAATQFIACITLEIQLEHQTKQLIDSKKLSPAIHQLIERLYLQIPKHYKEHSNHRNTASRIEQLLDSIASADGATITHLYDFLLCEYEKLQKNSDQSTAQQ
ncbi:MAG: hypothetical protein WD068_01425 [Candidatus Babeliales bacterium]